MDNQSKTPWSLSWVAMNARAWWYLNNSAEMSPSVSKGRLFHGIPRLRLWSDGNGFGCESEPTTWTVFEIWESDDSDKRKPVVREAVWKRTSDLRRLHESVAKEQRTITFNPTIEIRDADVSVEKWSTMLQSASTFQVPVIWFDKMVALTTDVGAQGFEFFSLDQPPAVLRLQWSMDKPKSWEPIAEWFDRVHGLLTASLSPLTK